MTPGPRNSAALLVEDLIAGVTRITADALLALGFLGSRDSVARQDMRHFLGDPRPAVAAAAAYALARLDDRDAGIPIVTKVLPRDPSGMAHWAAGHLRERAAAGPLLALLEKHDGNPAAEAQRLLAVSCWALGRIAPDSSQEALTRVAENPRNDPQAKRLATHANTRGGEEIHVFFLFPALQFLPTGITLEPGEMPDIEILGRWGVAGTKEIPCILPHLHDLPYRLVPVAHAERSVAQPAGDRPESDPVQPWMEAGPAELLLSPWLARGMDHDAIPASGVDGLAVIILRFPPRRP